MPLASSALHGLEIRMIHGTMGDWQHRILALRDGSHRKRAWKVMDFQNTVVNGIGRSATTRAAEVVCMRLDGLRVRVYLARQSGRSGPPPQLLHLSSRDSTKLVFMARGICRVSCPIIDFVTCACMRANVALSDVCLKLLQIHYSSPEISPSR